jgi:hypothetical protein
MHAHGDLIQAERAREEVEPECDWSGWEKWLRSHLDIERENLIEAIGGALAARRNELLDRIEPQLRKIGALELKLAELTGAVDVLRGKAPLPPAEFPTVKTWSRMSSFMKTISSPFVAAPIKQSRTRRVCRLHRTGDASLLVAARGRPVQSGSAASRGNVDREVCKALRERIRSHGSMSKLIV